MWRRIGRRRFSAPAVSPLCLVRAISLTRDSAVAAEAPSMASAQIDMIGWLWF
jgi:hypothetical protein